MARKKEQEADESGVAAAVADADSATNVYTLKPGETVEPVAVQLSLAEVFESEQNTRTYFDPAKMAELKDSLETDGQLHPVIVKPANAEGRYELLDGARRYRALKELGMLFIEAKIRVVSDDVEAIFLRLIANAQREDITPIEEGEAYQKLVAGGASVNDIARRVGKSASHIYARMELLDLGQEARQCLLEGKITAGHAALLLPIKDKLVQEDVCILCVENEWSVRQLDLHIAEHHRERKPEKFTTENTERTEDGGAEVNGVDLVAEAEALHAREAERQEPERKMEDRSEPVKDRQQLSGEKLTAAVKFETAVRLRALKEIIDCSCADSTKTLINLAEDEFSAFTRDWYEEAVAVAKIFGKEASDWASWIHTLDVPKLIGLLYAIELSQHCHASDFDISSGRGRPEKLLIEANRWSVDFEECEENERAAQAGTSAPKKAKPAKKAKSSKIPAKAIKAAVKAAKSSAKKAPKTKPKAKKKKG